MKSGIMYEYYYVSFKDMIIASNGGESEYNDLDRANMEIGNCYRTFGDALNTLKKIIKEEEE